MTDITTQIGVVDLFCGVGGLSHGMHSHGFKIVAGYDIDKSCKYAFEKNNNSKFYDQDVTTITGDDIKHLLGKCEIKILAGCAPCQPFSAMAFKVKNKDEKKYNLLYEFGRLVEESEPDIVTMENVAQIITFSQRYVLHDFIDKLESLGYFVSHNIVYCPDYGIPQSRKRLVLVASKFGPIELIRPTHTPENYVTVRNTIAHLEKINSGEQSKSDPLHRSRSLTEMNLKRIKATGTNGSWRDWPDELMLDCHKKDSGKTFKSVYGRMDWDKPAPTMTTLCTGLGNGRFGHPEQDRAISAREAALIQTFPEHYEFFAPDQEFSMTKISRYIGNAVPPRLGEITAESIILHLKANGKI